MLERGRDIGVLREFMTWWARQMLDLVSRWTPRDGERSKGLIVVAQAPLDDPMPTVELMFGRRRQEQSLGLFTLSRQNDGGLAAALRSRRGAARGFILRVPAAVLLERQVTLPLLAEHDLARVLTYEMDRLTPFTASELLWTWAIERRDRARGELHVRLSFLPRVVLRPLLSALELAGAAPAMVEAPGVDNAKRWLDPRPVIPGAAGWRRWSLLLPGGLAAILGVAAIGLPFVLQALAGRAVEARFAALSPRVARAETVRRELAARAASVDVFAAQKDRMGNVLEILGALTDILPDDTYLTELTARQRKLTLNGQSAAAARLIAALSASQVIRDPAFTAPVVRVENGQADLFSIRAEIAP